VSDRLASGHDRLDGLLGGGLPANAINLLIGVPGSGKSILAQQYLFRNATEEQPGLYLSTVSEPFDKVLRYGQGLAFFDTGAIGRSVFYDDLAAALQEGGLSAALARIHALVDERRPGVLVIDSFKPLAAYSDGPGDYRRFLHGLAARLSILPASTFWVGEYSEEAIADAPEFAVADAILSLATQRVADREVRVLRVLKLRGSGFRSGAHAYRISERGLDVFPRLADRGDTTSYTLGANRQTSGIAALDAMLDDGYWPGATTLVAGASGTGKTLMGLHFIVSGMRAGAPGLIAGFQENPTQLERIAQGFGWSIRDEGIHLLYRSPVDVYLDEWVYDLLDAIDETGARRVLIDSITDLQHMSRDETRFREYLYSLGQRCARSGISMFMTAELPELFDVTKLAEAGASHLSDNVVVLQYLRDDDRLRRALIVLKTRASRHRPEIREYVIGSGGITLAEAGR
jgi:circadian clock protein KaiC